MFTYIMLKIASYKFLGLFKMKYYMHIVYHMQYAPNHQSNKFNTRFSVKWLTYFTFNHRLILKVHEGSTAVKALQVLT